MTDTDNMISGCIVTVGSLGPDSNIHQEDEEEYQESESSSKK